VKGKMHINRDRGAIQDHFFNPVLVGTEKEKKKTEVTKKKRRQIEE